MLTFTQAGATCWPVQRVRLQSPCSPPPSHAASFLAPCGSIPCAAVLTEHIQGALPSVEHWPSEKAYGLVRKVHKNIKWLASWMPHPPDHPDLKAKSALWPQKNFVFCSVAVNIPLWSPCLPKQEHQLEARLYEQVASGKACVAMNSPPTISCAITDSPVLVPKSCLWSLV